ncbi:hypothetical protein FLL45_00290 [Aliikangiella marina]|uniref:Uncharacterized protein n=1 Tax=Aliikangiella marina TaxID=1712262 RepID=A0A545TGS6_9GAMM|nr:hypothetical protein [Aliikangiella marina]TQV76440.1 hypothetical protein FLL45_00290 [Aliikangiella marina]
MSKVTILCAIQTNPIDRYLRENNPPRDVSINLTEVATEIPVRMVDDIPNSERPKYLPKPELEGQYNLETPLNPDEMVEIRLISFDSQAYADGDIFMRGVGATDPSKIVFDPKKPIIILGRTLTAYANNVDTGEKGWDYRILFQYKGYEFYWDPIFKIPRSIQ